MRIRYIGAEASTDAFGKTFYRSQWVSVASMSDGARETLSTNPQFEVEPVIQADAKDVGFEGEPAEPAEPADPVV